MSRSRADRLWLVSFKRGLFKVKSFFSSLAYSESSRFHWKSVWQTQTPSKTGFFAWSAALGKILIVDNLMKRHVIIMNRCYLWKRNEESVATLFFTVIWLSLRGILSLLDLVCLGLYLEELSTCLPVGGILEGRRMLRFGR